MQLIFKNILKAVNISHYFKYMLFCSTNFLTIALGQTLLTCLKDCPSLPIILYVYFHSIMVCHRGILCIWVCMLLLHKMIYILVLSLTWVDQFSHCFQNYSPHIAFTHSPLFIFYIFSRGSVATPPSPASLSAEWSLCNMFRFEDFR